MKSTTVKAKEMSDDDLKAEGLRLRRQIPKDQALFDAIKREQRHRSEKALSLTKATKGVDHGQSAVVERPAGVYGTSSQAGWRDDLPRPDRGEGDEVRPVA